MLDIYLADRPVTDDNLAQIARHLVALAKKMRAAEAPLFLNLLRGCEIPAGVYRSIMPELEIVDIPLSVDEVRHEAAQQILAEFLPPGKFRGRELFWVDEALGLGMGQAVLKLLYEHLADGLKSLTVVFLAAENGKYINPEFKKSVDDTVAAAAGRIEVEYANVDYIHWMDNNRVLGINWGRRYTVPFGWSPLEAVDAIRAGLGEYRAGPMQTVGVGTPEFDEYVLRHDRFLEMLRSELGPHGYRLEGSKVIPPDGGTVEVPRLEDHVNDPHALWCERREEYWPAYYFLRSDPKTMIDLASPDAAEYRERLLESVKRILQ